MQQNKMINSDNKRRNKSRCHWWWLLWNGKDRENVARFHQRYFIHRIVLSIFPYFQFQAFNWNNNGWREWMDRKVGSITLKSKLHFAAVIEQNNGIFPIYNCSGTTIVRTIDNVRNSSTCIQHHFLSCSIFLFSVSVHRFSVHCNRS